MNKPFEMDVIARALETYLCELEEVRNGTSNNIRYTKDEYDVAKATLAKIRDDRHGSYVLYQP